MQPTGDARTNIQTSPPDRSEARGQLLLAVLVGLLVAVPTYWVAMAHATGSCEAPVNSRAGLCHTLPEYPLVSPLVGLALTLAVTLWIGFRRRSDRLVAAAAVAPIVGAALALVPLWAPTQ
jgi:hypothetical protein